MAGIGRTKTMVPVARERRFETFDDAWKCVDGLNGLCFSSFSRSLDGLLICAISFSEKMRFVVRGFLDEIFFFLKCGNKGIELLGRALEL